MSDNERLNRLIDYSSSGNRVCPQPGKWDALWRLLGGPKDLLSPPLVLSGWAFSTDREKRARFIEHLRHAYGSGLKEAADSFVYALKEEEWHTCADDKLDWSYGDALREEEDRRRQAVDRVAKTIRTACSSERRPPILCHEHLAEAVFLYSLMVNNKDLPEKLERVTEDNKRFCSSMEGQEWSLLDGVGATVSGELRNIAQAKLSECVFLEILCSIVEARLSLDRDVIEEIVEEAFHTLRANPAG